MVSTDTMPFPRILNPFKATNRCRHPIFADNRNYFSKLDQDRPIADFEYVVFDTELTGLNHRQDEIISIGAVRIRDLQIQVGETFYTHIRPQRYSLTGHTLIHRITPQQLENAPTIKEVLPEFVSFCGKSLLVAHYIGLDMGFMNRAADMHFQGSLNNPCLDTMHLAKLFTERSWQHYFDRYQVTLYDLESLSKNYGLPCFPRHDAMQDALQTAYLFLYLVKQLQEFGLTNLKNVFTAGQTWRNILSR